MGNYKVRGKLVLLDSHIATGTEATYTYTATPAITHLVYSKVVLEITMETTATLALELILNATTHQVTWIMNDSGTITSGQDTTVTPAVLAKVALIDGNNHLVCKIEFYPMESDFVQWISNTSVGHEGNNTIAGRGNTQSTISTINIATSTSTWKAGTQFKVYGIQA